MLDSEGLVLVSILLGVGALCLVTVVIAFLRLIKGSGKSIKLEPEGFSIWGSSEDLIPWPEATGVQFLSMGGIAAVGIGLTEKGRALTKRSKLMNKVGKASESFYGPGDLTVMATNLPMPLPQFYILFVTYAAEHGQQDWATQELDEIMKMQAEVDGEDSSEISGQEISANAAKN